MIKINIFSRRQRYIGPCAKSNRVTSASLSSQTFVIILLLINAIFYLCIFQTTTKSRSLREIKPGHSYQFRVSAVNEHGCRGVSDPTEPYRLSRGKSILFFYFRLDYLGDLYKICPIHSSSINVLCYIWVLSLL